MEENVNRVAILGASVVVLTLLGRKEGLVIGAAIGGFLLYRSHLKQQTRSNLPWLETPKQ